MFCPECGAEYREGFTHCSDCQVPLVERKAEGGSSGRVDLDLVTVFQADSLIVLSLAEAALQEAGVDYTLGGQRLYAAAIPVNLPVWIQVSVEDEDRARRVLSNLEVEVPIEEEEDEDSNGEDD